MIFVLTFLVRAEIIAGNGTELVPTGLSEKHEGRFVQTQAAAQLPLLTGATLVLKRLAGPKLANVAGQIASSAERPTRIEMVPRGFEPLLPT